MNDEEQIELWRVIAERDALQAENVQLDKEAREAFRNGQVDGITMYAHWKDGVQYVGTCGRTLKAAIAALSAPAKGE